MFRRKKWLDELPDGEESPFLNADIFSLRMRLAIPFVPLAAS